MIIFMFFITLFLLIIVGIILGSMINGVSDGLAPKLLSCSVFLSIGIMLLSISFEVYYTERFQKDMVTLNIAEYYLDKDNVRQWRVNSDYEIRFKNLEKEGKR